jgi:hypothetical protein
MIFFLILILIGYYYYLSMNTSNYNRTREVTGTFNKVLDNIRTEDYYKHQYIENADYIKQELLASLPIGKKSYALEKKLNEDINDAIKYAKHNQHIDVNATMSPLMDPIIKPSNYYIT